MYRFPFKQKNNLRIHELKVVKEPTKLKPKNNLNFSDIETLFRKPNAKHPNKFIKKNSSIFHLMSEPNMAPNEIIKNLFLKTFLIIKRYLINIPYKEKLNLIKLKKKLRLLKF